MGVVENLKLREAIREQAPQKGGEIMKCEKFVGITTEEACVKQQKAGKILCQTCNHPLTGERLAQPVKEIEVKHCKKCDQDKPATTDHFSPDKKSKDGLRVYCKPCTAAINREYQQKKKGGTPTAPAEKKKLTKRIPAPRKQPAPNPEKAGPSPLRLTVDFSEYPHLYEFVMSGPKEYLRSPENMVLYGCALAMKEAQ